MSIWRALLRYPGAHFVVLGWLAFTVAAWMPPRVERAPGGARTDEQLLLDAALASGLADSDRLVRDRLAGLVRLADAGAVEDAAALEREARRLGLERHDVVVRRHLVQMMELALAHGGARQVPTEAEMAAYLERHRERFVQPARLRFSQVFFARDRAGTAARPAAHAALERLATRPSAPPVGGDAFLGGSMASGSEPELARAFGDAFVRQVTALPVGRWSGPIQSTYGWHVVRVDERTAATLPTVDAVRSRIAEAMRAEDAAARLERRLAALRARQRQERS